MKTTYRRSMFFLIALLFFTVCSCNNELKVKFISQITYRSKTGENIKAKYYILSDKSLSFVKIILPDSNEYTLPNVMSASGAKYSDDYKYIWWTKSDSAFLETRTEDGNWVMIYPDCKAIDQ